MDRATTGAIIVPETVNLISKKYRISEMEALDKFYTSAAGACFADDEMGLYGQSALYIFGLFCAEAER
ncbi:MAG: hypothetical protein IJS61_06580 [Firmicutes bacterium]|nr:hypothetical protein [Bacillota bacterium]